MGPLLLVEPGGDRCAVEVLQRAAARFGADELEAVELAQDAYVIADVAQRLGELARAGDAVFAQALEDPAAEPMREGFGEPLI